MTALLKRVLKSKQEESSKSKNLKFIFAILQFLFCSLKATMESLNSSLDMLVDLTIFLTDMSLYKEFNATYNEYFTKESGPARSCIGVASLPHPSLLIEIKAVGMIPA